MESDDYETGLAYIRDMIAENPKFAEVGIAALYETAYLLTRRTGT